MDAALILGIFHNPRIFSSMLSLKNMISPTFKKYSGLFLGVYKECFDMGTEANRLPHEAGNELMKVVSSHTSKIWGSSLTHGNFIEGC
jgi:hypothetical protein